MSSDPDFASLEDVELTLAWAHEARRFTPWLAENLDRLSSAIGVPLELTETESRVGTFSADIIARDAANGSVVLIENQLYGSDHNHLGQIMTYLAGTEAEIVIWIARQFREEHLSALRWLNMHTDEKFAFFAVRVRVVRIADSPLAPLFEVVERPNNWERQLQERAREAKVESPVSVRRKAFWDRYLELYPESVRDGYGSVSSRWRRIPDHDLVISQWLSQTTVGVFVRGGRGRGGPAVAPLLVRHRERLEAELGVPLGSTAYPFNKDASADTSDPANWDTAIHWLESETQKYVRAIAAVLEGRE